MNCLINQIIRLVRGLRKKSKMIDNGEVFERLYEAWMNESREKKKVKEQKK